TPDEPPQGRSGDECRKIIMPAKSKKQQMLAGAALAAKRGDRPKGALRGASKSMASTMSENQLKKMANTKRKGKPTSASKSKVSSATESRSMPRSTREVLDDHLKRRGAGCLLEDLQSNYSRDVVLLCESGVHQGHDALRDSAEKLWQQVPGAKFGYLSIQTEGEYALLKWRAETERARADHGVDSFVIRDGKIVMQSIYYELQEKRGGNGNQPF
ncbi:MAG TPA: DUF3008 family protein, partial [Chthoniobacterales bacterium]|nr:DUF3008 family protein [Chthoniobacterales bacterium]